MNQTIEQIRERMGADASTEEAESMQSEMIRRGFTHTNQISETEWFRMIGDVVTRIHNP